VLLEYRRALKFAADAGMRNFIFGHPGQVDGLPEVGGTCAGPGLAGNDIHHGGFAGAVGTDNATQFTDRNIEVYLGR